MPAGFLLFALLVGQPRPLGLDQAIAAAEAGTRDVIRAETDLLLVDIDKARALATILPSISVSAGAGETFLNQTIEGRDYEYKIPGCQGGGPECNTSPRAGGTYDFEYKGYYDAFSDPVSQPSFTLGISGRQLIFDGGRWWAVLSRNGDIKAQQIAGLAIARSAARLNAVRRFYDLLRAKEGVKVAELQLARAQAQLERQRARLAAGEVGPDAIATAERNLAVDRVAAMQRRFAASNQGRALNLAMGREPEDELEIEVPPAVKTATAAVPPLVIPSVTELIEIAQENRPEIAQLKAIIGIVAHNIDIRKADRWPVLALIASYSRSSRRPERVYGDPSDNYAASIGLLFTWTLFTGGAIEASVTEAGFEMVKARAAYAEVVRNVKSEVLEKRQRLLILIDVHANALEAARASRRARTLVEAKAAEGKASALELRDAEILESQAVLSAIEGRIEIEVGQAELLRAIGTPRL